MRNRLFMFGVLAFAGCSNAILPPTSEPAPKSVASANPEDIEFSNWPKATEKPHLTAPDVIAFCEAPSFGSRQNAGLHANTFIVVRVNPEAFEDFKAKRPLAVGSVVIKEKHNDAKGDKPPHAYTVMIKREPGYDPDHGNWEYADVRLQPEKKVARGKIASCIACHDGKKNEDYLFRDYIK